MNTSEMTAWDTAIQRHARWMRHDIKHPKTGQEITEGRQKLLDKAGDPIALAEYLDDRLTLSPLIDGKSGLESMSLPQGVRWENISRRDTALRIAEHWENVEISPELASLPVFWAAVHYQAIINETAKGKFADYLLGASGDAVAKSNHAVGRLGSAPLRWGYSAAMYRCRLGRIYWQNLIARNVSAVDGQQLDTAGVRSFLMDRNEFYRRILEMSVSKLTALCNGILLSGVIDVASRHDDSMTKKKVLPWLEEIGKEFYGESPDFMDYETVRRKVERAWLRTVERPQVD